MVLSDRSRPGGWVVRRGADRSGANRRPGAARSLEQGFGGGQSALGPAEIKFASSSPFEKRSSRGLGHAFFPRRMAVLDIRERFSTCVPWVEPPAIDIRNQFIVVAWPGAKACNGRTWPRSAHHLTPAADREWLEPERGPAVSRRVALAMGASQRPARELEALVGSTLWSSLIVHGSWVILGERGSGKSWLGQSTSKRPRQSHQAAPALVCFRSQPIATAFCPPTICADFSPQP